MYVCAPGEISPKVPEENLNLWTRSQRTYHIDVKMSVPNISVPYKPCSQSSTYRCLIDYTATGILCVCSESTLYLVWKPSFSQPVYILTESHRATNNIIKSLGPVGDHPPLASLVLYKLQHDVLPHFMSSVMSSVYRISQHH